MHMNATITVGGLVGCCVVVFVAFVDADVINSMRKVHNVFAQLSKNVAIVGSFAHAIGADAHKNYRAKLPNKQVIATKLA